MTDVACGALAEAGWRFLCDKAGVAVLLIDAAGTIRFANAHARQLTGKSLEGAPLVQILLGFESGQTQRWHETPPDETRLVNVCTAAGLPETLYATLVPVGDELLFFGQTDADEQTRLRREVLVLNHELGNLSRELAQNNTDLADINKQKTRFLGMATHDLRKPVGLVLSYAEMLAEELGDGLPEQQQRLLDTIRSAADRMRRVIDDFLDAAMIEAGRLNLDLRAVGVAELVSVPLLLVKVSAARRNIILVTEPDFPVAKLRVDGPKIEQVFTNLLSNAIEHAPDGSTVRVGCRLETDGACFDVTDTGPGISEEQRSRLFGDFSGTGGTKKDGERSIGLGLAISRRIVEAHGGRMFVIGAPGGGATVGFALPAACLVETPNVNSQGGE